MEGSIVVGWRMQSQPEYLFRKGMYFFGCERLMPVCRSEEKKRNGKSGKHSITFSSIDKAR
jgi:hypothetical protein